MDNKTTVFKRSIKIGGRNTSVSLEDAFWASLREIANLRGLTATDLINQIEREKDRNNLSSAVRVFVLEHYRTSFNSER